MAVLLRLVARPQSYTYPAAAVGQRQRTPPPMVKPPVAAPPPKKPDAMEGLY